MIDDRTALVTKPYINSCMYKKWKLKLRIFCCALVLSLQIASTSTLTVYVLIYIKMENSSQFVALDSPQALGR